MPFLLVMVFVPAIIIALIEFPAIYKKKKYGNLAVVGGIWFLALMLASMQVLGFELTDPLDTLIELVPPFFDPVLDFLLPE